MFWFGFLKEFVLHSSGVESEKSKRPGSVSAWPRGISLVLHQFPKGTLRSVLCTASLLPAPPNPCLAQSGWQGQNHGFLPGMQVLCSHQDTVTLPPDVGAQSCPCPLVEHLATLPWGHVPARCPGSVLLSAFKYMTCKSQHLLLR